MRLTDKQRQKMWDKLSHLFGCCECPSTSKTCLYWKVVDQEAAVGIEAIIKEIEKL